jgi:hypothetical protein
MKKHIYFLSIVIVLMLVLTACGSKSEPEPAAEAEMEEEVEVVDPMQACADSISLPGQPDYPLLYCDNFEDDSLMAGVEDESKYMDLTSDLYNGKLTVRMKVKKLSEAYLLTPVENARDFVIQVEGAMASHTGHPYHKWGVMFKFDAEEGSYYYFLIDNNDMYYFKLIRGDRVTNLINGRKTEDLNPLEEVNTITIASEGDTYSFYINGEYQEEFKDNRLLTGDLGFYFIVDENTTLDWEFDNLVVYAQ